MKKNAADYRRIRIESDYSGFDFLLLKKPLQCTVKIPETVLLDKNGAPRDWIFNSGKLPHHPILKKRKENLLPFIIIRNFCAKHVPPAQLSSLKTISELKDAVRQIVQSKKDAQFVGRKKHLQIRTVDGEILQINILQFLEYIGENKFAEQSFYEKWRMIQERVSSSKLDESYLVESVRRNHIIESKSSKFIAVGTGNKVVLDPDSNDAFKEVSPSRELEVTETKVVEGYKFFDTFLNKKFFSAVAEVIECIEKNYKCVVESMTTRFVIDQDREPHLAAIQEIYLKPALRLFEMREFAQQVQAGEMKLDSYMRCLQQFIIENPTRQEFSLQQPVYDQRRNRCRGEFCEVEVEASSHSVEQRLKLPSIGYNNSRKVSLSLIESVKKRRARVIERLKEVGVISPSFIFSNDESSQYDDSEDEAQTNVKVCEHCFVFYVNVMKYFQIDAFHNLAEKKISTMRAKTLQFSKRTVNNSLDSKNREGEENGKSIYNSLRTLENRMKVIEDEKEKEAKSPVKRSASQHTRLRPLVDKTPKEVKPKAEVKKAEPKAKTTEVKSNKLIEAKLKNIVAQPEAKAVAVLPKSTSLKKTGKPTNFHQAAQQLMDKLQLLQVTNEEQFIYFAKKYYKDNLPQQVDRVSFSSEYFPHLYQFMSNSPLAIAPGNRIKKRPEMSLKRLSQLTSYPEIVSRSAFIFDTLICDEKTTIPFCVISSKMIHNNNQPSKPYQNVFVVNDIFDSYIEFISLAKEVLQEAENTRFVLFNYPGQSHTIYDKGGELSPSDFSAIIDKLIYRLGSSPGQLNIMAAADSIKIIGMGFGGFLTQAYLSLCPEVSSLVKQLLLVNAPPSITKKYKEAYSSLKELFSVDDPVTSENSFLFYNKAINSTEIEKEDLQNKAGLNSIRVDGRAYLLRSALGHWDDIILDNFQEYQGKVTILYGRSNILLSKGDLQRMLYRHDLQKTEIKTRQIIEIDSGHDLIAQNYDALIKHIAQFLQ